MNKQKKILIYALLPFFLFGFFRNTKVYAAEVSVSAKSCILMTADTKQVVFGKAEKEKLSMASTTKIMTALLAIERIETGGNEIVEITEEMVMVEGSSMGLRAGDKVSIEGLVTGLLLPSGNDAANAIALYISGSAEEFAALMNERAEKIGMSDTNFVTPSGLDNDEHYSTAYDMALLAAEVLKNPLFLNVCSSKYKEVVFENPEKTVKYKNHNKLLSRYEGCIGMKTGFTKKSGRCLVSVAEREGVRLISVTLSAPDDWQDHATMFNFGFSRIEKFAFDGRDFEAEIPTVGAFERSLKVKGSYGGSVTIPKGDRDRIFRRVELPRFVYAPLRKDETVGRISYYLDDKRIYSIPLKLTESAVFLKEEKKNLLEKIFGGRS